MTKIPHYLSVYYLALGLMSFFMYYKDKQSAQNGQWRTPEISLHLIDVLGGWVGASFAHRLLDHKATKANFRIMFYLTITVNILAVIGLFAFI